MPPTVAILGTRYPDFRTESSILGPQATIVSAPGATPDEIVDAAGGAEVILAGSLPQFTREVLGRLSGCRAIVRSGIGVDSVDLEAAREAGIWVINIPDYGTEAVAQHTLALALAAVRRVAEADRMVKDGQWGFDPLRPIHLPDMMTAGVVGFGRIGRRVTDLMRAVGFGRVLVHDPYADIDGDGIEPSSLEDLLSGADLVSLHAPGRADGHHLISSRELDLMKENSALVNTARGNLIDPPALARALAGGAPRIAALDVFSPEPPDLSVFAGVEHQLILTPHMAWYTEESQAELRRKSAEEAKRILEGTTPLNAIVNPEEQS
jgi:D-3-phosphoglycerate dehydrogenase